MADTDDIYDECMRRGPDRVVHASDVLRYVSSPFALWCDKFADQGERDPEDLFMTKLSELGQSHEDRIISDAYPESAGLVYAMPEIGFQKCLELMRAGSEAIRGAPLFYMPHGMFGIADVLERRPGSSIFGSHHYTVTEIKLARNIQRHHILQAAFYSKMLAEVQRCDPGSFGIIGMDGERAEYEFAAYGDALEDSIRGVREVLAGSKPAPVYGACPYPWRNLADRGAEEARDVSLVGGIGQSKRQALSDAGILTLDDLLNAGPDRLKEMRGVGDKTAAGYMAAARAIAEGRPIRKSPGAPLPSHRTDLFLDLEGVDPATSMESGSEQTDYLIGMVVRSAGADKYKSFVAENSEDESGMLSRFLDYMGGLDDFAIWHWHHYERTHLKMMGRRHGLDVSRIIDDSVMFDLHRIANARYAFPVSGTGLKPIAKWMGYEWKHSDVGALSSIILYQEYVRDPIANADKLQRVLDYNADDCWATARVYDWLNAHP